MRYDVYIHSRPGGVGLPEILLHDVTMNGPAWLAVKLCIEQMANEMNEYVGFWRVPAGTPVGENGATPDRIVVERLVEDTNGDFVWEPEA